MRCLTDWSLDAECSAVLDRISLGCERERTANELAACLADGARGLMVWWPVRCRLVESLNYCVVSVSS